MIKTGKVLCIHCGKVHNLNQVLWADRENGVTFELKRNGIGYKAGKIYGKNKPDQIVIKRVDMMNGFPKSVAAEFSYTNGSEGSKKRIVSLRSSARVCPECFNKGDGRWISLLPDAGFYPSYYIGLIGVVETGKTVFQNAICRQETFFSAASTEIRSLFIPETVDKAYLGTYVKAPEPTTLEKVESTCFTIRYRFKDLAKVYLVDSAGELGNYSLHESDKANKAIRFISDFCDAMMVLYDPRFINSPDLKNYKTGREAVKGSVSLILNDASHRTMPTAIVMSGADRLHDIVREKEGLHNAEGKLILTSNSELFRNESLTRDHMIRHCLLAKDVFESVGINTRLSEETGCFLVSSGRDGVCNGTKVISYETSMNIKYPVSWILNQMGIIEIQ